MCVSAVADLGILKGGQAVGGVRGYPPPYENLKLMMFSRPICLIYASI